MMDVQMNDLTITEQYGRLVSLSIPAPGLTLAGFLRQAHGQPRFFWENSRESVAFAASGKALELMAWGESRFDKIEQQVRDLFETSVILKPQNPLTAPRLFGGFAFSNDFLPDNTWAEFTPAHFVLPHYQLTRINDETWLTINTHIPFDENPDDLLPDLKAALQQRLETLRSFTYGDAITTQGVPSEVNYPMPFGTWEQIINDAIGKIRSGDLNKVVLSRVAEVQFYTNVNVDAALEYLAQHYAESYRFLFEPRPHHAFYGATPELIAGVKGRQISTMGLAGSIRRGTTEEDDAQFAQQLLDDPKERYEHRVVVDKLRDRLTPITSQLDIAETGILKLSNIQHLYTPIKGRLDRDYGILNIVKRLHPTPALGGDPRDVAMKIITESEPVPRGWYAAPIGWVNGELDGQFSVAIRSAVAQGKRVWMYAGAGIVKESIPQKEWDETALKFRPMLDALGIRDQVDV